MPKQVNNEVLRLLIEVLYLHDNVLIHSCLCALRNLCELETTFVAEVFNMGLHNALLQLKSDNQ